MFDNQNISKYVRRILEVKLPTIWTAGKAEVGIVRAEKKRCEKTREEEKWEERRPRRVKKEESRESLCFSNELWLLRVKK